MDYSNFKILMKELAAGSAKVIRPYFFNRQLTVEIKADQSLVTEADQKAEKVMRQIINEKYPTHGIIGEEFGNENKQAEFVWVLDPIDGTVSFASGVPLFGTLVGLLHEGKPVLGMIYQPILDLLCVGDNFQTELNGQPVCMRPLYELSQAVVLATDLKNIRACHHADGFEQLLAVTKTFRTWGDCYGYLLLASGWADIMLDPIMKVWDITALIPIINGAGGIITAWDGGEALSGGSSVAAHSGIQPHVIDILNHKK